MKNQAHRLLLQYANSHPGTATLALVGASTGVGVALLKVIDNGDDPYKRDPKEKMSMEEARFIAMVKDAKESSWQENLENAASAQDRFMLPGRQRDSPKFMTEIDRRSMKIMKKQHAKIDREKAEEDTATKFWK